MPWMTRRKFLWIGGTALAALAGLRFGTPWVMRRRPPDRLSDEAAAFAAGCFDGLDRSRIWDSHVHMLGLGTGGSGCWINPEMQSHSHPIKRLQYEIYREGTGMLRDETADADYVEQLLVMQRGANPEGKQLILAFDMNVDEDGNEQPKHSSFYTPDRYVLELARRHPEFVACASVHPYRLDALERLDAAIEGGARAVKWLPNAMGINLGSPRCDPFYERIARSDLALIIHGGREYAVDASHDQLLGNPLHLRRPLDAGVKVVVAHCASLGEFPDLDAPQNKRQDARSFDLFMRLFTDPAYEKNLFADISTLAQVHHDAGPLRDLLRARELHPRLIYGSDFPLPGLRFMVSPTKLRLAKLLGATEARLCRELFDYNPLLFDFAVARTLRIKDAGESFRFSPTVFETARIFEA
jgi:predicted TIM-barrel fold metal-dependent hydrolase